MLLCGALSAHQCVNKQTTYHNMFWVLGMSELSVGDDGSRENCLNIYVTTNLKVFLRVVSCNVTCYNLQSSRLGGVVGGTPIAVLPIPGNQSTRELTWT